MPGMGKFLTKKERQQLIQAHRQERNLRYGDRIKVILLLDANWPVSKIAEALLLDPSTINNYRNRYETGGVNSLLNDNYQGRACELSDEQKQELISELISKIYLSSAKVITFVKSRFKVEYSLSGITYLLHSLGFSYKKPKLVPGKADPDAQEDFLSRYSLLKESINTDSKVYFIDGVHPQHNSLPSYGWMPKGEETKLKSNTGRKRVNLSGALDSETHEIIVQEDQRLNAETTISFFKKIERMNSAAPTIYIILDNAGYYKGKKIRAYLKTSKIKLVHLPPYAPNLNLIERVWKFFKKIVLYNRYYQTYSEFREACLSFFHKRNLRKYRRELDSILTENFEIVSA